MSRPAVFAGVLAILLWREVSSFGFQLSNETIAAETYTVNEDDLEQIFEINQRGAIYDSVTGKRRYDNYKLIRVNPETDEHLDVLQFLDRGQGMVEMWSTIPYNASLVDAVEMVVSPRHEKHVKDYLSCSGMTPTVIEDDLQHAIDLENKIDPEDEEDEVTLLDHTRRGPCTGNGKKCIFPFKYNGNTYNSCTKAGNSGKAWCPHKLDSGGVVIKGKWADCDPGCQGGSSVSRSSKNSRFTIHRVFPNRPGFLLSQTGKKGYTATLRYM